MADDPFSHPSILSKIESGKLRILAQWYEWIANPTEGSAESKILEGALSLFDLYGETYISVTGETATRDGFDQALRVASSRVIQQTETAIQRRREQIRLYASENVDLEIRLDHFYCKSK